MAEEAARFRQSATPTPPQKADDLEEVDFFADPKEAVKRAVQNSPEVLEAKKLALEMKRDAMHSRVKQLHPDIDSIVQDPEFAAWVQEKRTRLHMLQASEQNYDAEIADELVSTYKMHKQVKGGATAARTDQIRQTQTDNLRAAQVDSGAAHGNGKKPIRREDIQDLMRTNPARYQALLPAIMQAYAEGRVKSIKDL
jgi:hypothetical protein